MITDLFIISGFLGAGKTTLIEKLITEDFQNEKVVIIENDFGETNVDASLLRSPNIEVKELSSGCICCSLSGDFVKALLDLLKRFQPDKILIEPSGVSKLSDIIKSCSDPRIQKNAAIKSNITVVDAKRCKKHLENFGEFFEDQIINANVVLLSHTDNSSLMMNDANTLIKSLNEKSIILSKPWNQLSPLEILCPDAPLLRAIHSDMHKLHKSEDKVCDHNNGCSCHHSAREVFETVTIRTHHRFSASDLKNRVKKMEHNENGIIIRAKGIVPGIDGYINLQYVPGDIVLTQTSLSGNDVCIIGKNLDRNRLIRIFDGE